MNDSAWVYLIGDNIQIAGCQQISCLQQSSKDFHVTDTKVSTEDKAVLLQATYLLAAGNLYVVTWKSLLDCFHTWRRLGAPFP